MGFIVNSNLPETAVTEGIFSPRKPELISALKSTWIDVLTTKPVDLKRFPVSHHADMVFHHAGKDKAFVSAGEQELTESLLLQGFSVTIVDEIQSDYPLDCALNCALVGNFLFAGKKSISREIKAYYESAGIEIVYVNQGYAKCSIAVVAENAIITADECIASAAKKCCIDTLLIKSGYIAIDKYDFGFIGGCCGKLGKSFLGFCGDITAHPSYNDIHAFSANRGVQVGQICGGELFDIGGILPITER